MATLPPGTLMQRAASGLAAAAADWLGTVYGSRVLLLVGAGDNGGDALYAGSRLARRGARVEVLTVAGSAHEGGMAALRRAGGRAVDRPARYDLVVDGIVGIGGRPGLSGSVAEIVAGLEAPVLAVDVPSGVGVDTGVLAGAHVAAAVTVTFGTHKVCHFVQPAAGAAGTVHLVDIGLAPYLGGPAVEVLQAVDVGALLPRPTTDTHKYLRGVLGVRAGSAEYPGAGLLVVEAAVAAGLAGMVRYVGASADLVRSRRPEVVVGEGRVQARVVGPGLGRTAAKVVPGLLAQTLPTVVDADGLGQLPARLAAPTVLTPHAGELARMLGTDRSSVEEAMLESACSAAARWNAVVVLKGSHSVVAAPDGSVRVNTAGVDWLATAGAGDVLSGVIGSLLAAGLSPYDAASAGCWLHGTAATLASAGGPLSAGAVSGALPAAVRAALAAGGGPDRYGNDGPSAGGTSSG